jgi:hypothetical protein
VKKFTIGGLAIAIVLAPACSSGFRVGPVGLVNGPSGDFADTQSSGVTIGALAEVKLAVASLTAEVDWTRFSGKSVNNVDTDAVEFRELAAGARFFTGPIIVGGQLGYLSGSDVSNDGIIRPEIGLRLGKLDLLARYTLAGDARWWSLGASFSLR